MTNAKFLLFRLRLEALRPPLCWLLLLCSAWAVCSPVWGTPPPKVSEPELPEPELPKLGRRPQNQSLETPETTAWIAARWLDRRGLLDRVAPEGSALIVSLQPPPSSLKVEPTPIVPLRPPLVRESDLDFAARAQVASALGSPALGRLLLVERPIDVTSSPAPLPAAVVLWADAVDQPFTVADPDLGVLRLRRLPPSQTGDTPNSGQLPQPNCDPELGCLRLKEPLPLPPMTTIVPRAPVVYLIVRGDYFRNSNLFSDQNPVADGLTRPGLTLYASPMLGRDTYFVASATGNLLRYSTQARLNADELFFRAGVLQRLSPTMFGEIGWSNQQLFVAGDKPIGLPAGTRFLSEHAIRLELSRRDRFSEKLSLSSFYQFRYSFADPIDRSRITNALTLSLNYDLQPNLQLGLDYQLGLASFTQQKRSDLYNQVLGRLTYTPLKNTQVSAFVGYGFGNSSDSAIRFNSLLVGVSVNLTLGLF